MADVHLSVELSTMIVRSNTLCIAEFTSILHLSLAIRIGFVLSAYTFQEPVFDDFVDIVLATENNVTSEQIFEISLTIANVVPDGSGFEVAELGSDYRGLPMIPFNRNFLPFQRELRITFELLADDTPEPMEAFMISSSSNALPSYLSPSSPFYQQTFVVIEDDDGERFPCTISFH